MLRAGFIETQNGLWLKVLTEAEYKEVTADFMKRAAAASSDKK